MLYFLLGFIAVGVLLASEDGKALLDSIGKIALIGGLLYLGFWAVVIAIGMLSDSGIRDATIAIVGYPLLAFVVIAGIVALYQKHKKGELGGLFKKHKFTFIFWGIWFVLLIFFGIVYPFFKDNSSSSPSAQNPSATAGTATGGFGNQSTAAANATSPIISTLGASSSSVPVATPNPNVAAAPSVVPTATKVQVTAFSYRASGGISGYDLLIPSGNRSTCVWTWAGGNADVPYSQTTYATPTTYHEIPYSAYEEPYDFYDFAVTCVDDFGNQYVGVFPSQ